MKAHPPPVRNRKGELLRHDRVGETRPGKARRLGQGAELDGAFLCPLYCIDAPGQLRFGYKRFISRIKQDDRVIFKRVIHPFLQLFLIVACACRIVRRAQVNDIRLHTVVRHRQEIIFFSSVHVNDFLSIHRIRIHIDRVDRIRDQDHIVLRKKFRDIPRIALRAVGNKHVIRIHFHAVSSIIICNRFTHERIPLLRAVSLKCLCCGLLVNSSVEPFDGALCKRAGHIPDPQADDIARLVRMALLISAHPSRDLREEITVLYIEIIFI